MFFMGISTRNSLNIPVMCGLAGMSAIVLLVFAASTILMPAAYEHAHAQVQDQPREIKIALLSDYGHDHIFEYAVSQFNKEQAAISSDYVIVPKIVDISSGANITDILIQLESEGYVHFAGPFFSSNAKAASEYANGRPDMILISPSSTAPSLAVPDSLFRLVPTDASQAQELMRHVAGQGKEHVVVVYRNDVWGNDLLAAMNSGEHSSLISHRISIDSDAMQVDHAAVAADVSAKVGSLALEYGHDRVAVILATFNDNTAELVKAVLADSQAADSLGSISWYGTDGIANSGSLLADNLAVAEFMASVGFTATLFTTEPNPINLELDAVEPLLDASYGDGLYDAVFLLADTVIVHDAEKQTNPEATARSLVLYVANGQKDHDYHDAGRTVGDGAIGAYELDSYGDVKKPLSYAKYKVFAKPDGSFGWEILQEIRIGFLSDFEHKGAFEYAVDAFNYEQHALGSGYMITGIISDNISKDTVAGEIRRLAGDGYTYFVGPMTSSGAAAAVAYADTRPDTVLISPSSTAASLAVPDSLFRLVPDDGKQTPVIVGNLEGDGKEHVVIIYREDEWGLGLLDSIERLYAQNNKNNVALKLSLGSHNDGSAEQARIHADVAARAADEVGRLVSQHGADRVAVLLISFDRETASLVRAIISDDAEHADILGSISWYGTDGAAGQQELVADSGVAKFLSSVGFAATKFAVPANPINAAVRAQDFADDATYGDNVYDAVFLLADTIITYNNQMATSSDVTVKSLVRSVANGLAAHDSHSAERTPGAGALGDYTLGESGDLSFDDVGAGDSARYFPQYVIFENTDGSFEWRTVGVMPDADVSAQRICR